jgi:hypothetical protein
LPPNCRPLNEMSVTWHSGICVVPKLLAASSKELDTFLYFIRGWYLIWASPGEKIRPNLEIYASLWAG